jgi:hypothetical protein
MKTNKNEIYKLIDILIASEKVKDGWLREDNKNLTGESSTLFHLKRLREMISQELGN